MRMYPFFALAALLLFLAGCDQSSPSSSASPPSSPSPYLATESPPSPTPTIRPAKPDNLWNRFDASRALATAQTLLRFGPRIAATVGDNEARAYLRSELESSGWTVTEQTFTVHRSEGDSLTLTNLLAEPHAPLVQPAKFLVLAHFDTLRSSVFTDPGATDGAANSAVLIELARTLALDPELAACTRLFLLDGHYPLHELTAQDGLYGSRALLAKLRNENDLGSVQAVIAIGNVGCAEARLNIGTEADPNLKRRLEAAAKNLGVELESAPRPLWGEQTPFAEAGLPTASLLQSDAPFLGTADDDTRKLAQPALANTGRIIVCFLSSYDLSKQ